MKFYSPNWYAGIQSLGEDDYTASYNRVSGAYGEHLRRIRSQLPAALHPQIDGESYHDARIWSVSGSPNLVEMEVEYGSSKLYDGPRILERCRITFQDAVSECRFFDLRDPDLPVSGNWDDATTLWTWLHDEISMTETPGVLRQEIFAAAFSPGHGALLDVRFRDCTFTVLGERRANVHENDPAKW